MIKSAQIKPSQKRQQLSVARTQKRPTNETDNKIPSPSASKCKLSFRKLKDSEGDQRATQQWVIINVVRLNELVSGLICPNCAGTGL